MAEVAVNAPIPDMAVSLKTLEKPVQISFRFELGWFRRWLYSLDFLTPPRVFVYADGVLQRSNTTGLLTTFRAVMDEGTHHFQIWRQPLDPEWKGWKSRFVLTAGEILPEEFRSWGGADLRTKKAT